MADVLESVPVPIGGSVRVAPGDAPLSFGGEYAGCALTARAVFSGTCVPVVVEEDGTFEIDGMRPGETYDLEGDGLSAVVECVVSHYCTLDQVLHYGDGEGISPIASGCTPADAFEARARAEQTIEEATGRSFVPVASEETLWASAGAYVTLRWPDVTAVHGDAMQANDAGVRLIYPGPTKVGYIHGPTTCPMDIRAACTQLAASYVTASAIPERASAQSTDDNYFRFTLAGVDGPTGIPGVDAILARRTRVRLAVG